MMTKTKYRIVPAGERLNVEVDGKIEALGFSDEESALHAIFTIEGKVVGTFYSTINGIVFLNEELPAKK